MELNAQDAKAAVENGDALEYRRTPHTDWMRCPYGHEFNMHFYYRRMTETERMEITISLKVPVNSKATYVHGAFCFAADVVLRQINSSGPPKVDEQHEIPMPHGDSATFFRSE